MTEVHELSRRDARRVAVRAQLLAQPRPTDLLDVVRRLGFLQADPTAAVAPNADLVLWCRLGSGHHAGDLAGAVDDGSLVELRGLLRPAEDLALYRAEMAAWPGVGKLRDWEVSQRDWVSANDGCRRDILDKLYDEGPLPGSALPDTTVLPWQSSGWNNDRNVRMLLELMVKRGEVATVGRDRGERLWDLAERIYPDDPIVPLDEALRQRARRRLRALGISRPRSSLSALEQLDVSDVGEPAVVHGVRGTWRVDPSYLDGPFTGRAVLLSPLDQLVYDRKRMAELFGFDYQLEMYKPAAKRRWGYWAMPVLHGDSLVGKLDLTSERDAGILRVNAVHEDGEWSAARRRGVQRELAALASFLDLRLSTER